MDTDSRSRTRDGQIGFCQAMLACEQPSQERVFTERVLEPVVVATAFQRSRSGSSVLFRLCKADKRGASAAAEQSDITSMT
jgi:hypothetical protein